MDCLPIGTTLAAPLVSRCQMGACSMRVSISSIITLPLIFLAVACQNTGIENRLPETNQNSGLQTTPSPTATPTTTPTSSPEATPTPSATSTPTPSPTLDRPISSAELNGTWNGPCQRAGDQTLANRLIFAGTNQVSGRAQIYSGAGCSGDIIVIVNMLGTYKINGTNPLVTGATDFAISLSKVTATPTEEYVAGQLNFIAYCGYSDWQAGKARAISLNNLCLAGLPLTGNQIARIDNATLYFGNKSRTAIDFAIGYKKQ